MFTVSARVLEYCQRSPDRMAWLARLPHAIAQLEERWQLSIGERFDGEGDASWVAPAVRRDGSPGVLKLGMPHMEAEHEADGLRFWNGDPTVRLLSSNGSGRHWRTGPSGPTRRWFGRGLKCSGNW